VPERAIDPAVARSLRLLGFDVDGVFTDGGVFVGRVADQIVEFKRFDIQDGMGVKLLRAAGIAVVLVSGRHSEATIIRAREIEVDDLIQDDAARKLPAFESIMAHHGVGYDACGFAGDDLADLPLLTRVALPIAVANAVPEVKAVTAYETRVSGGRGAVREIAEVILRARGVWDDLVHDYLAERDDAVGRTT
jgi:3-deoxy-D-manno-octulosonate 8-phosphate phosphatase (KDO 8-P phosphatase)